MDEWIEQCPAATLSPEENPPGNVKRHAELRQEEIDQLEKSRNESNTIRQTKWAVKCFEDWCKEKGVVIDFQTTSKEQVNGVLRDFYATVRNGKGELYRLSSYVGLRAGLNRYISDLPLSMSWCLIKDTEFTSCNKVFTGVVKTMRMKGLDVKNHHASISEDDFRAIKKVLDPNTPEGLVKKVWFDVQLHFGRRGKEGNRRLKPTSFTFKRDGNGLKYATLNFNEHANYQNDPLARNKACPRRFMYEQRGDPLCPISSLEKYLSHLPSDAPALYLHPRRNVRIGVDRVWYTREPMGVNHLATMLSRLCLQAGTRQKYTNLCLGSTTSYKFFGAGHPTREQAQMVEEEAEGSDRDQEHTSEDEFEEKGVEGRCSTASLTPEIAHQQLNLTPKIAPKHLNLPPEIAHQQLNLPPEITHQQLNLTSEITRQQLLVKEQQLLDQDQKIKQKLLQLLSEHQQLLDRGRDIELELKQTKAQLEIDRQQKLLDTVFNPHVRLLGAALPPDLQQSKEEQQEWSPTVDPAPPHIKEEEEDPQSPHIKEEQGDLWPSQEGEQLQGLPEADLTNIPFILYTVPIKGEEEEEEKPQSSQLHQSQTEENSDYEPPDSSSTEEMDSESDAEDCGVSEAASPSQPVGDGKSSDSSEPESENSDDWMETGDTRLHTGDKLFNCSFCDKSFANRYHLTAHTRIHAGEKPFTCSVCLKTFNFKAYLNKHMMQIHGDKPFNCSVCGKTFGFKGCLKRHMRIHTGDKPFNCLVCGKRFVFKTCLNKHMRIHTGDKPFTCSGS